MKKTRISQAAVALMCRRVESETLWLVQWNGKWRGYHLISGHKNPDESFRDCIIREIKEELGLEVVQDYNVAIEPVARLEYTAMSKSAGVLTDYTAELFWADLCSSSAIEKIDANPANRWLTEDEVRARQTKSGEAISETMEFQLTRAGIWK